MSVEIRLVSLETGNSYLSLDGLISEQDEWGSLNNLSDSSLPVASEERKGVQVWFISLKEIEAQKAFDIGTQLAEKTGGTFNGLNFFTLGSSQPQYKQAANLFVTPEHVAEVADTFAKELGLSQKDGYIFQALPSSQYVPRTSPNRTAF